MTKSVISVVATRRAKQEEINPPLEMASLLINMHEACISLDECQRTGDTIFKTTDMLLQIISISGTESATSEFFEFADPTNMLGIDYTAFGTEGFDPHEIAVEALSPTLKAQLNRIVEWLKDFVIRVTRFFRFIFATTQVYRKNIETLNVSLKNITFDDAKLGNKILRIPNASVLNQLLRNVISLLREFDTASAKYIAAYKSNDKTDYVTQNYKLESVLSEIFEISEPENKLDLTNPPYTFKSIRMRTGRIRDIYSPAEESSLKLLGYYKTSTIVELISLAKTMLDAALGLRRLEGSTISAIKSSINDLSNVTRSSDPDMSAEEIANKSRRNDELRSYSKLVSIIYLAVHYAAKLVLVVGENMRSCSRTPVRGELS